MKYCDEHQLILEGKLNLKKALCFLVVLAIAPFLCAFQADNPGENLGFVGGGGQNQFVRYGSSLGYMDYWYFNIPYKHVFGNGNMSVGAVFTYMHFNYRTRSELIPSITSIVSEFRLTPYWSHNPSRYFGYNIGVFINYNNAHGNYDTDFNNLYYILPSLEIRAGAMDLVYFSLGVYNPDLAGDVSGMITAQLVTGQKLIPYTQLSAGAGFADGVPMILTNNSQSKWAGIVPMFSIKVTPIKLLSIVASLKMSGEQIWNVSSGVEFHF